MNRNCPHESRRKMLVNGDVALTCELTHARVSARHVCAVCQTQWPDGQPPTEPTPVLVDLVDSTPAREPRTEPCVHLGEPTGELRLCPTCKGHVRLRVFQCLGGHGEIVRRDCQTCEDYRAQ